jgi:hypothetical protein
MNSYLCACKKIDERKVISSLSLELVKVGGYDFTHPCDGPRKSRRFFKWSLVDIELDMPDVHPRKQKMAAFYMPMAGQAVQMLP